MPLDPETRLNAHFQSLIGREAVPAEIIEIMRLTRHVIERNDARKAYPHLSLFCDWVQHVAIDRNAQGLSILERMNDAIIAGWANTSSLTEGVNKAFDLPSLRKQMSLLFTSKGVSLVLVESFANWRGFVGVLLNDISDKPVTLGVGRQAVHDRMRARWAAAGISDPGPVRALTIENRQQPKGGEPPGFYWNIEVWAKLTGNDHFILSGAVLLAETVAEFSRA